MLDVALTAMGGLVRRALRGGALGRHPARFEPADEPGRYVAVSGGTGVYVVDAASGSTSQLVQVGGFGGIDWTR